MKLYLCAVLFAIGIQSFSMAKQGPGSAIFRAKFSFFADCASRAARLPPKPISYCVYCSYDFTGNLNYPPPLPAIRDNERGLSLDLTFAAG
jgi:hypothetical protein